MWKIRTHVVHTYIHAYLLGMRRLVKTRCRLNFLWKSPRFNSIIPRPFTNPFELCINLFKRQTRYWGIRPQYRELYTGRNVFTSDIYIYINLSTDFFRSGLAHRLENSIFFVGRRLWCGHRHDFPSRIYILIKIYSLHLISLFAGLRRLFRYVFLLLISSGKNGRKLQ